MKKSLTYATIAVLLGVAFMFMPLSLVLTESKRNQRYSGGQFAPVPLTNTFKESSWSSERLAGITPHFPADEISAGLMSAFSLVLAFTVFKQFKKRTA